MDRNGNLRRGRQSASVGDRVGKDIVERLAVEPESLYGCVGVIDDVGVRTVGINGDRTIGTMNHG